MDIEGYLASPESSRFEFKEKLPSNDKLASLMCAFANCSGGDLIVGIEDRTAFPAGVDEKELLDLEEKIATIAATSISPMIFPIIKSIRYKDATLLFVHVDMGFQKPYRVIVGDIKDTVFVRVGSTTRQADSATVESMRLRSKGHSWDCLPCYESSIDDIDKTTLEEFLLLREQRRNIHPPAQIDSSWLVKMRLAVQESGSIFPTNGAIVLFSRTPEEYFPSIRIELARFAGISGSDFIDKKTVSGPLWKHYEPTRKFMRTHIPTLAHRTSGARIEKSCYPEIAFREFMINALCHRSFERDSGPVRCAIFDDSIQITNSGTFPDGLEIQDIGTGISMIRNPLIARIFNELGLIEGWGTGIQVAQQELARYRLPSAQIEQKGFFIQVTSLWRWNDSLTAREKDILQEVAEYTTVNSMTIANKFGITDRAARKLLMQLVKKEYLSKTGTTRGSQYKLK